MKEILLLRFSAMGDVAMLQPVLRQALAQYPDLRFRLLSRPAFAPFFAPIDRLEFVGIDLEKDYQGLGGIWRLSKELQKGPKPLAIADMHNVLRTQVLGPLLSWSWGIPLAKMQKERGAKKQLAAPKAHKNIQYLRSHHLRYADVLAKLGFPIDLSAKLAPPIFEGSTALAPFLTPQGPKLGVAPKARYAGKTYPLDLMQQSLEALLAACPNLQIYLFGGPSEGQEFSQWPIAQSKQLHIVAGQLPLSDELALMSQLTAFLAMDSSNMHMAAFFEKPIVSLWGASHPAFGFYPWRQPLAHALLPDYEQFPMLPSSRNGSKMFKGYENAMASISPQQIVDKLLPLLQA
ncbi:glycosyltransferase family 9 protein [Saprospira grandis]|uniref:glycosyltransferase family 9 protein n=1 Tax=Saprospira grandis TaxID=1008 RepID=UPI0022DE45EB|nr:glycosyltransferase family 9 protein [Saprospira grandis]WBM74078.1 glycosyltransferase family 9 protein [Saprospira grandis]